MNRLGVVIAVLLVLGCLSGCTVKMDDKGVHFNTVTSELITVVMKEMEKAYMEGQRGAIEGKVIIHKVNGKWKYKDGKSPWSDGAKPTYEE